MLKLALEKLFWPPYLILILDALDSHFPFFLTVLTISSTKFIKVNLGSVLVLTVTHN